MRTYEEALAHSRDVPAFSNGTEGYGWMENWCFTCIHDKPSRQDRPEDGCPLIVVTLMQRTPAEFLDGPRDEHGRYSIADQYHCVEYRDEDDPGPGEDGPTPPPPEMDGQLVLFDPGPYRRPRMYELPGSLRVLEMDAETGVLAHTVTPDPRYL